MLNLSFLDLILNPIGRSFRATSLDGFGRSSLSDPSPQPCLRNGSSSLYVVRLACAQIHTSTFGLVLAFLQLVAASILPLPAPLAQAGSQSSMLEALGRRWQAFSQPYHAPESLLPSLPPLTAGSPSSGLEVMACPSELSPCPLPDLNLPSLPTPGWYPGVPNLNLGLNRKWIHKNPVVLTLTLNLPSFGGLSHPLYHFPTSLTSQPLRSYSITNNSFINQRKQTTLFNCHFW